MPSWSSDAAQIERLIHPSIVRNHARRDPRGFLSTTERLIGEPDAVTCELTHLARAIAAGGELDALVLEMKSRQERAEKSKRAISPQNDRAYCSIRLAAIEETVNRRLPHWRSLSTSSAADARDFLREALVGPI